MADSPGNTDSVLASPPPVRDIPDISIPWAWIAGCVLAVLAIVASVLYIFIHLLDQDKVLLRIDQNLCTVAIHDAQIDKKLAIEAHSKIVIEVPIDCQKIDN